MNPERDLRPLRDGDPPPAAPFCTTRWTQVPAARGRSPEAREALRGLCDAYYEPIVSFLARRARRQFQFQYGGLTLVAEATQETTKAIIVLDPITKPKPKALDIIRDPARATASCDGWNSNKLQTRRFLFPAAGENEIGATPKVKAPSLALSRWM